MDHTVRRSKIRMNCNRPLTTPGLLQPNTVLNTYKAVNTIRLGLFRLISIKQPPEQIVSPS